MHNRVFNISRDGNQARILLTFSASSTKGHKKKEKRKKKDESRTLLDNQNHSFNMFVSRMKTKLGLSATS